MHFSEFNGGQGLAISVAKYTDGNFGIFPSPSSYEAGILKWVVADLGDTSRGDFLCSLEAFLYLYSQANCIEKVDPSPNSLFDRVENLWLTLRFIETPGGECC